MTEEEFARLFRTRPDGRQWPITIEGRDKTYLPVGSFDSYTRNSRQQFADYLNDKIYGGSREGYQRGEKVTDLGSLLAPPLELGHGLYDTTRAVLEGRLRDAAVDAGLAFVPGPDTPFRKASKNIWRGMKDENLFPVQSPPASHPPIKPTEDFPQNSSAHATAAPSPIAPELPSKAVVNGKASGQGADGMTSGGMLSPNPSDRVLPAKPAGENFTIAAGDGPHVTNIVDVAATTASRDPQGPDRAHPASEQNGGIRAMEASEGLPSPSDDGALFDWDKLVFEDPTPGQPGAARSSPWVVADGPPFRHPRPFKLDFPNGAVVDKNGKILKDIDGNDLIAKNISGRVMDGEKDQGLTPAAIRSILEDNLKIPILRVPKSELGQHMGLYLPKAGTSGPVIKIWNRLPPDQSDVVTAHELGHAIHDHTGWVRPRGLTSELNSLFKATTGYDPRLLSKYGYIEEETRYFERIAEAIHTAAVKPNTLKTIAPKTAHFLREIINKHPFLSRFIQVNGIPVGIPMGAAAVGAAALRRNKEAHAAEPPSQRGVPQNFLEGAKALPFSSLGPAGEATEASTYGLIRIAKALAGRSGSVQGGKGKSEEFKNLVQMLVNLETKRRPQAYGDPR